MAIDRPSVPDLADWALARGRVSLTSDEIAEILDVPRDQVSRRLHPRVRRAEWTSPAQGLWIPVPPQYRLWGAPPGIEVVDAFMQHMGVGYYVGWLSAAALYGATHQAVQVFQVATDRDVRDRQVGRTRFRFHTRRDLAEVPTRQHTTPSGYTTVSTVSTTALDVATDTTIAAGIDNAATVIIELAEHPSFSESDLVATARHYPAASVRRIGWILENLGGSTPLDQLHEWSTGGPPGPARLNPSDSLTGPIDKRWNVSVNAEIEAEA